MRFVMSMFIAFDPADTELNGYRRELGRLKSLPEGGFVSVSVAHGVPTVRILVISWEYTKLSLMKDFRSMERLGATVIARE